MALFQAAQFDFDAVGDATCSALFSQPSLKNKKKVRKGTAVTGKVTKREKKDAFSKQKKEVIKQQVKSFVSSPVENKPANKKKLKKNNKVRPLIDNETSKFANASFNKTEKKQKKKKANKSEINESKKIIFSPSLPEPQKKEKKRNKNKLKPKQNEEFDLSRVSSDNGIKKKKLKKKKINLVVEEADDEDKELSVPEQPIKSKKEKMKNILLKSLSKESNQVPKNASLRDKMLEKLKAARFRFLNEQIYSNDGKEAQKIFKNDPDSFTAYHEGYRQQVNKWPLNPLDNIIKAIQRMPASRIIADFGCGEGKLAQSVQHKVHSFDLVAANDSITACDMAHVPLPDKSVDVAVFCLSLMGTNLHDYLNEANRVLKIGGILKIAEVESRFEDVSQFITGLKRFHFKNLRKDLSHKLFYFLDFKKEQDIANKKKVPTISLHPCLYKKR